MLDNHAVCLILPLIICWVWSILKNKTADLFSITNQVLSYFLYIFAHCFTSKLRQIKRKDKEIKKNNNNTSMRKMWNLGFELTDLIFGGRSSNPLRHGRFTIVRSIFPIYRQPVYLINSNTGKNCVKAIGTLCLSANIVKNEELRGKNVETVKTS